MPDASLRPVVQAAAYQADSRDRDRHAFDAASPASSTTRANFAAFKGSDRKRLLALHRAIGDHDHPAWRALCDAAEDAYLTWRLLVAT